MSALGQVWSRHSFGTVTGVSPTAIRVMNEFGREWEVDPKLFADEFSAVGTTTTGQVVKLTQTELSTKFAELPRQAVTVNFNKKLDEKELIKQVQALSGLTKPVFDKKVKELLSDGVRGEERTMMGYHYGGTDAFGRIHFTEIAPDKNGKQTMLKPADGKTYDARHRLVDPRTVNWFIAEGVRYEVK